MYRLIFEDRPEQNTVMSGLDLMEDGITVNIEMIGSEIIWLFEENE